MLSWSTSELGLGFANSWFLQGQNVELTSFLGMEVAEVRKSLSISCISIKGDVCLSFFLPVPSFWPNLWVDFSEIWCDHRF